MTLDKYRLLKSLGSGGMGEVFIAEDLACKRVVALKQIRKDLEKIPSIRKRFLREALIPAKLNHPCIIPIFTIHNEEDQVYYTMPYVQGKTLKQILKEALQSESLLTNGIRIFMNICQAVAYCHSKGILHRDLKPDNIIVGTFGEVFILDWGLAQPLHAAEEGDGDENLTLSSDLTLHGKVVGTLAYLAPERAQTEPASEQTDLYALGVILYQLLTLTLPFKRIDIHHLKKYGQHEEFIEPIEAAPYRDIPHGLNQIAKKCLEPSKKLRYQKVSHLISDLQNFIEGKPEWIFAKELHFNAEEEWEFEENILLSKHTAITHWAQSIEWVNLRISKTPFPGNIKLQAQVKLGTSSEGVGFLLNIPEKKKRKSLMEGYCIWIGSTRLPGCKLFRCNIEVAEAKGVQLEPHRWYEICLEKIEGNLSVFIENKLKICYVSNTPLNGAQVGLLIRDGEVEVNTSLFKGSQNVMVSCLAIPDAFLADKNYEKAVSEYNKIALSFPGRTEGREARFRAGIALLEKGILSVSRKTKNRLFSLALEEFGKLRGTAGGPLEYLGKSLVYKASMEIGEEAKCLELALRKYSHHPLFPRIVEQVVFRLHEASSYNRIAAYHFALITLRHLPHLFSNQDHLNLIQSIKNNWEEIPLFHAEAVPVYLAFLLAKPMTLVELIAADSWAEDSFYALLTLGCFNLVKKNERLAQFPYIIKALEAPKRGILISLNQEGFQPDSLVYYLVQEALDRGLAQEVIPFIRDNLSKLWAFLFTRQWEKALFIFTLYPSHKLREAGSALFSLYGIYLWIKEGEEAAKAHLRTALQTPFPPLTCWEVILGNTLGKKRQPQLFWEQLQLYRQLILFYHCSNQLDKKMWFVNKLKKIKRKPPL